MRKTAALLMCFAMLALACPLAMAETAVPDEAQAFYDAINDRLVQHGAAPCESGISCADNLATYVSAAGDDFTLMAPMLSRGQYDGYYYWYLAEDLLVSVCYIGDSAAAFCIDGSLQNIADGISPHSEAALAFTEAYDMIFPGDRSDFSVDSMLSLDTVTVSETDGADVLNTALAYGDLLVSVFKLKSFETLLVPGAQDVFSVQLQPYSAYEALERGAQENHETTCQSILLAQKNLLDSLALAYD